MTGMAQSLLDRWTGTCAELAVSQADAANQGDVIVAAYSDERRVYHDLNHLAECFTVTDAMTDLDPADKRLVELALWFHDLVYDPTASDNEAASAAAARDWMNSCGVAGGDTVASLIEMTAGHRPAPVTPVGAAVHDADLAILGAPPERYDEYVRQIRAEYRHLPDHEFAAGRRLVMESFANLESIYLRPDMVSQLEEQARANIARELSGL